MVIFTLIPHPHSDRAPRLAYTHVSPRGIWAHPGTTIEEVPS